MRVSDRVKHLLRKGSFGRNIATLLSGTLAAQSLAIAALPFLTRAYSPQDFGIFAVYNGVVTILSIGICARYDMAILLPRSDSQARYIFYLALVVALILSACGVLVVLLVLPSVVSETPYATLTEYMRLLPVSLLALGVVQAVSFWLARAKRFRAVTSIKVQQVLLAILFQYFFSFLLLEPGAGLIWGLVVAHVCTFLYCMWWMRKDRLLPGLRGVRWPGLWRLQIVAKMHRQLPFFSLPSGLMNAFTQQTLSVVLAVFFPASMIGYISLAQRAANVPMNLMSQSIGQVLSQRLAENVSRGRSNVVIIARMFRILLVISLLGALPLVFWAPEFFELVFGSGWSEAGIYLVWLLPIGIARLCVRSVSRLFIYGKNRIDLVWQACFMTGAFVAVFTGGLTGDVSISLIGYSIFGAVMYLLHLAMTLHYAGGSLLSILRSG